MFEAPIETLARSDSSPGSFVAIGHAEVPRPPARWERLVLCTAASAVSASCLRGLGVFAVVAIVLWMLGAPWLAPWLLGVGVLHYAAAVTIASARATRAERARGPFALPLAPEVDPDEIASSELRASYLDILRLHEDIRRSLIDAERIQASVRAVLEQCGAITQMAGRLARLANPLHHYLDRHGPCRAKEELRRLATAADSSSDPLARGAYRNAAAARGRQLGTLLEIQGLSERIRARLELIAASLESVAALVITLQVVDLEQLELAGDSMSEQLTAVGEELAALEQSIEDL